jgi:L-ascorbate oxidase
MDHIPPWHFVWSAAFHRKIALRCFPTLVTHLSRRTSVTALLSVLAFCRFAHAGDTPLGNNALLDLPVCSTIQPLKNTSNCHASKGQLTATLTATTTAVKPMYLPALGKTITLSNAQVYNGTLASDVWEVTKSDVLKILLVNQLSYESDSYGPLERHLTNLHTHGLIVKPSVILADKNADPKTSRIVANVGDNVLACTAPKEHVNDCIVGKNRDFLHSEDASSLQYNIHIPGSHPEGLYWYHPHWHGAAASQVGRGLSGLIWVDRPDIAQEYHSVRKSRYLSIKDMQVGGAQTDSSGAMTGQLVSDPTSIPVLDIFGSCLISDWRANLGQCTSTDNQNLWLFTVNGQVFPDLDFDSSGAEVWKIANTSANTTYLLSLVQTGTGTPIPMQVVGTDGVALSQDCVQLTDDPRCNSVLLMPASRVVLYATRPAGIGANPVDANLISKGVQTGWDTSTDGDSWPSVSLVRVRFPAQVPVQLPKPFLAVTANAAFDVRDSTEIESLSSDERKGAIASAYAVGGAMAVHHPDAAIRKPLADLLGACPSHSPSRLGKGQARLVVLDITGGTTFMMGAGVISADQVISQQSIAPDILNSISTEAFAGAPSICTHAGSDETWIIANKRSSNLVVNNGQPVQQGNSEMHNFHIHQTKYEVVDVYQPKRSDGTIPGFEVKEPTWKKGVLHDTFPVPIDGWIRIKLHFGRTQIGDFVYHCHILEHEDAGMMAHIRVLPKGVSGTP